MKQNIEKPYILHVAEIIYLEIYNLKKKIILIILKHLNDLLDLKLYKKISSGKFHDEWFSNLKKNNFIDQKTTKKNS